ncbi:cytochrome P450 [Lineolata rhizophorae]|uniref:Cytochrome P450 n=1 Tax=Lineolata rhizophorae TaxID=578093 RepID=A0A6A6PAK2_9PEZI|nr:cytochrome P450 [Lineolata rhizophorae]
MGEVTASLPPDLHPHTYPWFVASKYNLPPVFYLDLWPAGQSMVVIADVGVAESVAVRPSFPKSRSVREVMAKMLGDDNIVIAEGDTWKRLRAMFNPGFSSKHIMSFLPSIVDEVEVFRAKLKEWASQDNKVVRLEDQITYLTVDIISKVVLNHPLNSQKNSKNDLVDGIRIMGNWVGTRSSSNLLKRFSPRVFLNGPWYFRPKIDNYINNVLDQRLKNPSPSDFDSISSSGRKGRKRNLIDLALDVFISEADPVFRERLLPQVATFVFAGHDTTSSTLCWAYHLLARNPHALAALRAEHSAVLGPDPAAAPALLRTSPHLLNELPYTLAAIRETLRLFPPASTIREAPSLSATIRDPASGAPLPAAPTEDTMVWVLHSCIHRSEALWGPTVHDFLPERFLPAPRNVDPRPGKGGGGGGGDELPWPENAWRPFERGPRNCIGQELALVEARAVLALTAREFDVRAAYDRVGALAGDGSTWEARATSADALQEVWGDPAYQILQATAKPRDGMPAVVSFAKEV